MSYLEFNFNLNDKGTTSKTVIISEEPYIEQSFLQLALYDKFNVKIGYESSNTYVQQVGENQYAVRAFTTYNFKNNNSAINWQYNFVSDVLSYKYPTDKVLASNIISTTGDYYGKSGVVTIKAYESGLREATIGFNFN